jgi:hypothetical protein
MVTDFRRVNPTVTKSTFAESLGNKRYRLSHYNTPTGVQLYGVVASELGTGGDHYQQGSGNNKPVRHTTTQQENTPHQPYRRSSARRHHNTRDSLFGIVLLSTLGFVVAYMRESRDNGFNRFMNSESFGPKFVMATIGSLIDGHWKRIERGILI